MAYKEKKDSEVPSITVNAKGRIGKLLERLAKFYEAAHPGRAVRWVYAPEHKPDLSNVLERKMDGYELVRVEDLKADDLLYDRPEDDLVRVGDLVLMSTTAQNKMERVKENEEAARNQRAQVERAFYEEQEKAEVRSSATGDIHRAKPRGRATVREAEVDLNRDQRSSTEGGN